MFMSRLSQLWPACYVRAETFLDLGSSKDLSDEDRALLDDFYADEFENFDQYPYLGLSPTPEARPERSGRVDAQTGGAMSRNARGI